MLFRSFAFSRYNITRKVVFDSYFIELLRVDKWLYHNKELYSPSEILYDDLDDSTYKKDEFSDKLIELLYFKINEILPEDILDGLNEKQRKKIELIEKLEKADRKSVV